MRLFNRKIFDELVVAGAAPVLYLEPNGPLAETDNIAFQAIITAVSGTAVTFSLAAYYSGNGSNLTVSNIVIIATTTVTTNTTNVLSGTITAPIHGYIVLQVAQGGTNPSYRVKLYACGRGRLRTTRAQQTLRQTTPATKQFGMLDATRAAVAGADQFQRVDLGTFAGTFMPETAGLRLSPTDR